MLMTYCVGYCELFPDEWMVWIDNIRKNQTLNSVCSFLFGSEFCFRDVNVSQSIEMLKVNPINYKIFALKLKLRFLISEFLKFGTSFITFGAAAWKSHKKSDFCSVFHLNLTISFLVSTLTQMPLNSSQITFFKK